MVKGVAGDGRDRARSGRCTRKIWCPRRSVRAIRAVFSAMQGVVW